MDASILNELLEAQAAKRAVVLATRLSDGIQKLVYLTDKNEDSWLLEVVSQVLTSDKSRVITDPQGVEWFLNAFNPPLRMIVIGAVHIARPLSIMGHLAGYDVTIVDPREAFASPERFPDVTVRCEWPDEAMAALAPDARTAVVTLTHDPKLDDPALVAALNSPCFYIGALGSKKTHGSRLERLKAQGFNDQALSRIHGPIGLNIGGKSPAEIAISIMGEITSVLRQ